MNLGLKILAQALRQVLSAIFPIACSTPRVMSLTVIARSSPTVRLPTSLAVRSWDHHVEARNRAVSVRAGRLCPECRGNLNDRIADGEHESDKFVRALGVDGRSRGLNRRRVLLALLAGSGSLGLAYCGAPESEGRQPVTRVDKESLTKSGGTKPKTDLSRLPKGEARPAPDFALRLYQGRNDLGGVDLRVSEIIAQGKPLVLNFWAGLCPPCRAEMPDLEAVYAANKSKIALVGVDAGPFIGLGTVEQEKSLAAELGVTYPLATTTDATVIADYRVLGMPTTAFITPDGMIQRVWTGLLNEEIMTRLVNELLEVSS